MFSSTQNKKTPTRSSVLYLLFAPYWFDLLIYQSRYIVLNAKTVVNAFVRAAEAFSIAIQTYSTAAQKIPFMKAPNFSLQLEHIAPSYGYWA